MAVYFIQAGEGGPVKIGTANDVSHRLAELQAGSAQLLSIIRTIDGGRPLEGWLHRHFSHARIRSEWFAFSADMLTISPPCVVSSGAPLDTFWLQIDRLAAELGVPAATRKKWRQRKAVPGRWHLRLVNLAERRGEQLSVRRLMNGVDQKAA